MKVYENLSQGEKSHFLSSILLFLLLQVPDGRSYLLIFLKMSHQFQYFYLSLVQKQGHPFPQSIFILCRRSLKLISSFFDPHTQHSGSLPNYNVCQPSTLPFLIFRFIFPSLFILIHFLFLIIKLIFRQHFQLISCNQQNGQQLWNCFGLKLQYQVFQMPTLCPCIFSELYWTDHIIYVQHDYFQEVNLIFCHQGTMTYHYRVTIAISNAQCFIFLNLTAEYAKSRCFIAVQGLIYMKDMIFSFINDENAAQIYQIILLHFKLQYYRMFAHFKGLRHILFICFSIITFIIQALYKLFISVIMIVNRKVQEIPSKIIERNIKYNTIRKSLLRTKFQWLSKYISVQIPLKRNDNQPSKALKTKFNKFNVRSITQSHQANLKKITQSLQKNKKENLYWALKKERLATQPDRPIMSNNMHKSSLLLQNINPNKGFTFVEGNSRNLGLKQRTNIIVTRKPSSQNSKPSKIDDRLSPWNYDNESITENKQNLKIF